MSNTYYWKSTEPESDSLSHHGVKGMKWGVRREIRKVDKAWKIKTYVEKHAKNPKSKKSQTFWIDELRATAIKKEYDKLKNTNMNDIDRWLKANRRSNIKRYGEAALGALGVAISATTAYLSEKDRFNKISAGVLNKSYKSIPRLTAPSNTNYVNTTATINSILFK